MKPLGVVTTPFSHFAPSRSPFCFANAVSMLFGLSYGGAMPLYAILVREYFPAREAGMQQGGQLRTREQPQ